MKKFNLPIWTDTLFIFTVVFLLFLVLFRFSMPFWLAIMLSITVGISAALLYFFFLSKRQLKKYQSKEEKEKIAKLSFHLAITTQEENNDEMLAALRKKAQIEKKEEPILKDNAIYFEDKKYICNFLFEKITADILSPFLRGEVNKIVFAALDFTPEAKKLAANFQLKLLTILDVYMLFTKYKAMPEKFVEAPYPKNTFWQNVQLHFSRKSCKGYLFSGSFLLLFSFITIFPVYYIIAGIILLAIAVFLRFFGRKEM